MKNIGRVSRVVVMLAVLLAGSLGSAAQAAAPVTSTGNGYRISPVRTDLTLAPGQSKTVTVFIKNVSSAPENLQVQANDFQAKDETGAPALLLNGESAPSHGLKQYMVVPSATIALQPGEQKAVDVQVKLPANTVAGGYFGAARFVPAATNGSKTVNLAASVASLFLVRVAGTVNEKLSIASFDVRQGDHPRVIFTNSHNLIATVRFLNQGDIQEEPFGKVLLNKGKTVVTAYEINNQDPKSNVLPSSIRRFDVHLDKVGKFGKYTAEGNFGYGSSGQLVTAQTTFYVIPITLIILVLAIILFILFLILGLPRLLRAYNRRVIARARRYR